MRIRLACKPFPFAACVRACVGVRSCVRWRACASVRALGVHALGVRVRLRSVHECVRASVRACVGGCFFFLCVCVPGCVRAGMCVCVSRCV